MDLQFQGSALRLARLYNELTLEAVAQRVNVTRQYIHKLETGGEPTFDVVSQLAAALDVRPGFFYQPGTAVHEEAVHFRKQFTTRAAVKQYAMAKAEVFRRLVSFLDREVELPAVKLPSITARSVSDVEAAAEACRAEWGLGQGPIDHMVRLAENVGAVVTTFSSISSEVDALSVSNSRPIIVRNSVKESPCRQRFDIGHELGHAVLHQGIQTGDRSTEAEANRFAGALLVPQAMMIKWFPRQRRVNLDWAAIGEFKHTWGISKAAALYRAWDLKLISDEQHRRGVIHLKMHGEAIREKGDELFTMEHPELVAAAADFLKTRRGLSVAHIAEALHFSIRWCDELIGRPTGSTEPASNVVHLRPALA